MKQLLRMGAKRDKWNCVSAPSAAGSIVFVLNSLAVGGSETKIIRVANALARAGTRIDVAYLNPPDTARDRIDPSINITMLGRKGKFSFRALRHLQDLANRDRQTIVAVNLYPLLYVVPTVMGRKGVTARSVSLINTAELVGRQRFYGPVYAPLLRRCDILVFGCKAQQQLWVNRYRLPEDACQVIYNGVDYCHFSPTISNEVVLANRREIGIQPDAVVVGSVGRLDPEKNLDLLIEALAKLNASGRDTYGLIVGQGRERAKLERLAMECGVSEKVRFLGLVSDVRNAIAMMDIFTLPSCAIETFSNAALEAMAMARPVVLSNIGGASEMVDDGRSGLLFPVGDLESLTGKLNALHDSQALRGSLGSMARERVVRLFGFAGMVNQYKNLLLPA